MLCFDRGKNVFVEDANLPCVWLETTSSLQVLLFPSAMLAQSKIEKLARKLLASSHVSFMLASWPACAGQ